MSNPSVDIIIPCYNESKHLNKCLKSILNNMKQIGLNYEIFFIDNGSTDGSTQIAEKFGLDVYKKTDCNVGALRNYGANIARGDVIVFLDADVEISSKWSEALLDFINNKDDLLIATGAPCLSPLSASLLEKHWFDNNNYSMNYINSGNLLTTRKTFETVSGFDEKLKSGEDSDYCLRVKKNGGSIVVNWNFEVYHHGYPKNIRDFFIREMWHGEGDFCSVKFFFNSKPALLSVINGVFLFLMLLGMFFEYKIIAVYFVWLLIISFYMAGKRSLYLWQMPGNMVLSIVYIFGRLGSLFRIVTRAISKKIK